MKDKQHLHQEYCYHYYHYDYRYLIPTHPTPLLIIIHLMGEAVARFPARDAPALIWLDANHRSMCLIATRPRAGALTRLPLPFSSLLAVVLATSKFVQKCSRRPRVQAPPIT